MNNRNMAGRLVIENKGVGAIHEKKFFMDIQEAILKGYRIAENTNNLDTTMRNYRGHMGRAVLYKDGIETLDEVKVEAKVEQPVQQPVEQTKEEKLMGLTKKADLLAYAKELGVEVPENITSPAKVKKIIKQSFTE